MNSAGNPTVSLAAACSPIRQVGNESISSPIESPKINFVDLVMWEDLQAHSARLQLVRAISIRAESNATSG